MEGGELELGGGSLALQPMRLVPLITARRYRAAHIHSTWNGLAARPARLRSCLAAPPQRHDPGLLDKPESPLAATITDNERMLLKRAMVPMPPPAGYHSPDYTDESDDPREYPGDLDHGALLQLSAQPAKKRAGASFHAAIRIGKFHGMI